MAKIPVQELDSLGREGLIFGKIWITRSELTSLTHSFAPASVKR